jgi:hypothetical protein
MRIDTLKSVAAAAGLAMAPSEDQFLGEDFVSEGSLSVRLAPPTKSFAATASESATRAAAFWLPQFRSGRTTA